MDDLGVSTEVVLEKPVRTPFLEAVIGNLATVEKDDTTPVNETIERILSRDPYVKENILPKYGEMLKALLDEKFNMENHPPITPITPQGELVAYLVLGKNVYTRELVPTLVFGYSGVKDVRFLRIFDIGEKSDKFDYEILKNQGAEQDKHAIKVFSKSKLLN